MDVKIVENILEYMNSRSRKEYTLRQAKAIRTAIWRELKTRKEPIRSYSNEGKKTINLRTAAIANEILGRIEVDEHDVRVYKRSRLDEFSDRNHKCIWGFREKRIELGYDPDTGLELEDIEQ